jgi:hypothetical protein
MGCDRHGMVSAAGELCPVCLLEQALAPATVRDLVIQVPLGHGVDTSVFLVRQEAPSPALLRLKVWRRPAPESFVDRVMALASRVEKALEPAIVPPVAACLDAAGCPAVLSPFRRGLPIIQSVRARALRAHVALALLDSLGQTLDPWHRAGLAHGSLVAGNVLVDPDGSAAFLVDFGLAALFGQTSGAEAAAMDRAGLNALASVLRTSRPTPIASAS